MSVFPVYDVTDWQPAAEEELGTKPKMWLYQPMSEMRWLWKEATRNPYPGGAGEYQKGDDWAEKVASELATVLGVPAANVELAHRGETLGTISLDFTQPHHELTLGNELLAGQDPGYAGASARGDARYTVEAVFRALQPAKPPLQHPILEM